MKARTLIENDDKLEITGNRPDKGRGWPWRDELYALGFQPMESEENIGDMFPLRFGREWNGHQVTIDYLYAVRQWAIRIDGKVAGGLYTSVEGLLDGLNNEILVADINQFL